MASIRRLAERIRSLSTTASAKAINPTFPRLLAPLLLLNARPVKSQVLVNFLQKENTGERWGLVYGRLSLYLCVEYFLLHFRTGTIGNFYLVMEKDALLLSWTIAFKKISLLTERLEQHRQTCGSEAKECHKLPLHMALAGGLLGFGLVDVAFADSDEAASKASLPKLAPETAKEPPESPSDSGNIQHEIAKRERARLEDLLKSKGCQTGSYPHITVEVIGEEVLIYFRVPPSCEILIANLVSHLGVRTEEHSVGSDMKLGAQISQARWHLILRRPKIQNRTSGSNNVDDGELSIFVYRSFMSDKTGIQVWKQGSFTFEELDALATVLQIAGPQRPLVKGPKEDAAQVPTINKTISSLEVMGVKIFGLQQPNVEHAGANLCWDNIAGYDNQKRDIENRILLALKNPEVYDDIARGTRCKFESNRPRAVLFEGPPGTGKTSCARVIAYQAAVPLLYVPLEIIMSKNYGVSERLLEKVFSLVREIPNGAIIFLDEIDAIAIARNPKTHEATRKLLSILLNQIDGFEQEKKVVVIAATNRKQDLDPAIISRFDSTITFGLPDQQTRETIIAQYAKHLSKSDLAELAIATEEFSGRDIRDVCQQAERKWASKIIRGQAKKNTGDQSLLPPFGEYVESAFKRRRAILGFQNKKHPEFDFI